MREAGIALSWERAIERLHKVKALYIRFADGTAG